jgi:hypothetical protein
MTTNLCKLNKLIYDHRNYKSLEFTLGYLKLLFMDFWL